MMHYDNESVLKSSENDKFPRARAFCKSLPTSLRRNEAIILSIWIPAVQYVNTRNKGG